MPTLRLQSRNSKRSAPNSGEETRLVSERALLQNSQKLIECLAAADEALKSSQAENALGSAARLLERARRYPGMEDLGESDPRLAALTVAGEAVERALIEFGEASFSVEQACHGVSSDPLALETAESRLFALRGAARKYSVTPDELADVLNTYRARETGLETAEADLKAAIEQEAAAKSDYETVAAKLRALRLSAGKKLTGAVATELKPLKLDAARFQVAFEDLPETGWTAQGYDGVSFEVSTNPGAPFGQLKQIASGGELARFALALKVCLAATGNAPTLVFDEADQGVGGAVAAAIGERLSRLSEDRQVLAITHSPQVAACAHAHWKIAKSGGKSGKETLSSVTVLEGEGRLEEVARMLAGAEITGEARAAAKRLMSGAE